MISTWGATGGLKPAMSLNLLSGAISSLVTFSRSTVATVTDFEGVIKNTKINEARFDGMRRVENLLTSTETLSTQSVTVVAGTHVFTLGSTSTGSVTFSGVATGTLAGDGISRKYITLTTTAGSLTVTVTGTVNQAQLENVIGQVNQNPSEYTSKGLLSYPYQGAGVDGVQYFPYTNPNCAINGAITQIPTIPINSSNSKWAYNCTTAGDYFSTPSSTANRITGDLSLLAQVALDDWTPTTVQCLIVKDGVSAGTRSWAFNVQASGVLRLNVSFNGTALFSYDSTVATGFTDRTVHYVGVQRESSTGIIRFYTSEDGRTFTQLGADVAGTAGTLYDATTQPVQFGNLSGLNFALDGKIYDSHVYSGLKFTGTSTMVMDFDPSNWTTGTTFTGLETGEVWTLNGNAKIYQGLWDATGPSSLLIEESRTNLVTYSSGFDVGWVKDGGISVTANQNIAPDGTQAMDLLSRVSGTLNSFAQLYNLVSVGAGGNVGKNYTFSVWVQSQSGTVNGSLTISDSVYASTTQIFTATTTPTRFTFTSAIVWNALGTYIAAGINLASVNTQIYIWGAQLEAGSFATSYIPTTSAEVTRTADQASMTGTNFSSWYNQAQGTLYVDAINDIVPDSDSAVRLIAVILDSAALTNALRLEKLSNLFRCMVTKAGTNTLTSSVTSKYAKLIQTYSVSENNAGINGVYYSETLVGSPTNPTSLGIGSNGTLGNQYNGHIRKINYYATALPSAVLQSLTS